MTGLVKICGIRTADALDAALRAGADWIGFVRYAASPRHVALPEAAALSEAASGQAKRVLLLVDSDDRELGEAVESIRPDMLQLHGGETPERVREIGLRTGLPVLKALGIAQARDLGAIAEYRQVAAGILLDAKPPRDAGRPGGNGVSFDWSLLRGLPEAAPPLVLSGGLRPDNVAAAVAATGIGAVDVSSGVESAPGLKDPHLIAAFVSAARAAFEAAQTRNAA